ncbi:MAG: endo alpha-1,4 polygalactosaminidase [Aminipila sp.]
MKKSIVILITIISALYFLTADKNLEDNRTNEYGVFLSIDSQKMVELKNYKTIVIDAANFSREEISALKQDGHKVYSYLNIGSLEDFRPYYKEYSKYTLGKYKNWEEEQWIDVSAKDWQELVIKLAKDYEKKGVDGYFIDNCDVYYVYKQNKIYNGLVKVLGQLKNSGLDVIINGGDTFVYEYYKKHNTLEEILTGINQETVFSRIDFQKNKFGFSSKEDRQYFISYLHRMNNAGAEIYLLEYTNDEKLAKQINKYCTKNNWKYYISDSIELD